MEPEAPESTSISRRRNVPVRGRDEGPNLTRLLQRLTSVGVATWGLFIIAFLFALDVASAFFIPVVLAHLLDRLLSPIVWKGKSIGIPLPVGAAIVVLLSFGALGGTVYSLRTPATEWIETAPRKMRVAEYKLRGFTEPLQKMRAAAKKVEEAAGNTEEGEQNIQVQQQRSVRQILMNQTWRFTSGLIITIFLLYFLLASGDMLLRKVVQMLPLFSHRKNAVRIIRSIERDLSRYLGMLCLINLGLGAAVWGAMYLIGMPNPSLWGALAGLLNFIPYLGPAVNITVVGLVAVVSFDSITWALTAPLAYLLLNEIEASLVTPTVMGWRLHLSRHFHCHHLLDLGVGHRRCPARRTHPCHHQNHMRPDSTVATGGESARTVNMCRTAVSREDHRPHSVSGRPTHSAEIGTHCAFGRGDHLLRLLYTIDRSRHE